MFWFDLHKHSFKGNFIPSTFQSWVLSVLSQEEHALPHGHSWILLEGKNTCTISITIIIFVIIFTHFCMLLLLFLSWGILVHVRSGGSFIFFWRWNDESFFICYELHIIQPVESSVFGRVTPGSNQVSWSILEFRVCFYWKCF